MEFEKIANLSLVFFKSHDTPYLNAKKGFHICWYIVTHSHSAYIHEALRLRKPSFKFE